MLNFTGQARRRTVNLGNRSATTKQDILLKAQRERERRAKEHQREAACAIIQFHIRRYLADRFNIRLFSSTWDRQEVGYLVLVFGPKLIEHLDYESVSRILNDSKDMLEHYPGNRGNLKLCGMMAQLKDDVLIQEIVSCLNLARPVANEFVAGVRSLLMRTQKLSQQSITLLLEVVCRWNLNHSEALEPLFEIRSKETANSSVLWMFYQICGSLNVLPASDSRSSVLLENLAYIYCHVDDRTTISRCIASCFRGMHYIEQDGHLQTYVTQLYEKPFLDFLTNLVENEEDVDVTMENFVSYIESAPNDNLRDSAMISLLSRPSFLKKLYSGIHESRFGELEFEPTASFSIFVRLLEMYLLVSTDHELLSEYSGFTVKDLVAFTTSLKDFVFHNLWHIAAESRPKIVEDTLPLLQKLYLRDSRLHFCSKNKDLDYWSSKDVDFLQVSPFKYIEDYERLYREYADKRDELLADSNELSTADEASAIKFQILARLSSMYKSSVSTRQFKKLEILIKTPFFIPFEQRVDLFYLFIALDKQRLHLDEDSALMGMFMPWHVNGAMGRQSATISRENILDDACNAFNSIGERFKAKLAVTFVNEFGPEAGVDGGGITKEFLTSVSEEGFNSEKYSLFQTNSQHELYPSTAVDAQRLRYLWFLGKILGKCLYDHVLIDVAFADFFLKKMLNPSSQFASSFDDLQSLDIVLYSNLVKLLTMTPEQIASLDLAFETDSLDGRGTVVPLIPDGNNIAVTKENVLLYIIKVADFRLNKSLFRQIQNFHGGMSMIIAPHWMEMFNSVELQMLISGGGKDIDLADLKANTEYGGYQETDKTINDFWSILQELESQERLNFIKFVTSVPRAPLQGFRSLEPRFGIRNAGRDLERLPTASTCVNLLKLPDYQDKELLRQKLLYSINSGARFDLS
ncbi:hypothetical protein HG536_0A02640 [Torulaspora globosa]|uniref:HECT-type E3 ubiquitin transferase n=1 Tax=Torulaspora globosa TaxID=48254 RepID=A0A7G3ZAB1_9SACH|nr:uncharacterized protein HG536_0A02640 [Torulaspora globosa]QLL30447.1 hypothetical protein HG536_0A02640 [Torulaspora globosa]